MKLKFLFLPFIFVYGIQLLAQSPLITLEKEFDYLEEGQTVLPKSEIRSEYDSDGNVIEVSEFYWDEEKLEFYLSSRTVSEWSANNLIKETRYSAFFTQPERLWRVKVNEYEGNCISKSVETYFSNGDSTIQEIGYYNNLCKLDSLITIRKSDDGNWNKYSKEEFIVESTLQINLIYGYDNQNEDWFLGVTDSLIYDDRGNLIYYWSDRNFEGEACKIIYEYDANDNVTLKILYHQEYINADFILRWEVSSSNFYNDDEQLIRINFDIFTYSDGIRSLVKEDYCEYKYFCDGILRSVDKFENNSRINSKCYFYKNGATCFESEDIDLLVYPNPVTNELNIEGEVLFNGTITVEIFNSLGQLINIEVLEERNNKDNIDLSYLSNGLYILRFRIDDIDKTFKIMKL